MVQNISDVLLWVMLARSLFVAAECNIAEHLAYQPMAIAQLAKVTNTHEQSLERLMRFLMLNDVFMQDEEGNYCNNQCSSALCADHPNSIKSFVLHDDETRWNCFGHLGYSIKTGKAAFDMLYQDDYFGHLKQRPVLSKRFDDAMITISEHEDRCIASKLPLQGRVVDIGGGKGQLLNQILENNHQVKAVLFDLPVVVEHANDFFSGEKIPGSFFEPMQFDADYILLKRIMHDWSDDKALIILQNIVATMRPDTILYIIDGIVDRARNTKLLSAIDLALLTIFQGQERNMQAFAQLCDNAGLEIVQVVELTDIVSAIECRKKQNN